MKINHFLIALAFSLPLSGLAQIQPSPDRQRQMQEECNQFLKGMPAALQQRQAAAVRQATAGDPRSLQAIRRSRNSVPELPAGVEAEYVHPTLRLYRPSQASSQPRSLVLYLHGGGWAFGSINSCARFCAALALSANCCVAALDYRLAPEHPYPAALDDSRWALQYLFDHARSWGCDTARVSVAGDSAGGNLAIALALTDSRLEAVIPIYPVTRVYEVPSVSWNEHATGYGCDVDLLDAFYKAYAPGTVALDPLVSVAHAPGNQLARLPRTLVLSAGRDALYDQGTHFVRRLRGLGVNATQCVFPTATHLFITVPGQPTAFACAVETVANFVRR